MRSLRNMRIMLAMIFIVATCVYFILPEEYTKIGRVSAAVQIIPSLLSVTIGATAVWLVMTFIFGRVYCSTVCPLGTLQDFAWRLTTKFRKEGRYISRKKYRIRIQIFWLYVGCIVIGFGLYAALLEPWNIIRDACFGARPGRDDSILIDLGLGVTAGIIIGVAELLLILFWAAVTGRDFCNKVCPVGTLLGCVAPYSIYHIEIDPDRCSNCMRCEQICRSHSIKVLSRFVDNARCVRCFDCVAECPDDAIHYQINRNRPAMPLFQRRSKAR